MRLLPLSLLFAFLALEGKAQTFEEITSDEKTLISKISDERRAERFHARHKKNGITLHQDSEPLGKTHLDIFPDTLYAGEPFDVHYGLGMEGEATYELYVKREKRPRKMATKRLSKLVNGNTVLRITLPEPGEYEIVAWDEQQLIESRYPEMKKSRWTFTVYPRTNP